MVKRSTTEDVQDTSAPISNGEFTLQVPDPDDEDISEFDFQQQVGAAWEVCDRFDLQTDIWRGRILRAIRDREKIRAKVEVVAFSTGYKTTKLARVKPIAG